MFAPTIVASSPAITMCAAVSVSVEFITHAHRFVAFPLAASMFAVLPATVIDADVQTVTMTEADNHCDQAHLLSQSCTVKKMALMLLMKEEV